MNVLKPPTENTTDILKSPSDCPVCNGQREWVSIHKIACYFCGYVQHLPKRFEFPKKEDILSHSS